MKIGYKGTEAGGLILSPNDSKERSTELFNEWMKEIYGK